MSKWVDSEGKPVKNSTFRNATSVTSTGTSRSTASTLSPDTTGNTSPPDNVEQSITSGSNKKKATGKGNTKVNKKQRSSSQNRSSKKNNASTNKRRTTTPASNNNQTSNTTSSSSTKTKAKNKTTKRNGKKRGPSGSSAGNDKKKTRGRAARAGELTERKTPEPPRFWSKEEDITLKALFQEWGTEWKKISEEMKAKGFIRSDVQCLHRFNKCLKPGLVKGHWTYEEDMRLKDMIAKHGGPNVASWSEVADYLPGRLGKQCRERYFNHLDPRLKRGPWTNEEDEKLIAYVEKYGRRWAYLSTLIEGRSENNIKNRYYLAQRKLKKYNGVLKDSIKSIQTGSRDRAVITARKVVTENGVERMAIYMSPSAKKKQEQKEKSKKKQDTTSNNKKKTSVSSKKMSSKKKSNKDKSKSSSSNKKKTKNSTTTESNTSLSASPKPPAKRQKRASSGKNVNNGGTTTTSNSSWNSEVEL
eukprot:g635.t1